MRILFLIVFLSVVPFHAFEAIAQDSFKNAFGSDSDSKDPLLIKSDSLSLDAEKRTFTYKGGVEITRGDVKIKAERVVGKYNEKNEIHTVLCTNNIIITRGDSMKANADRAVYKVKESIITLSEGPELERAGNLLSADKITIFVDEDRSEAEGNVRVKVIQDKTSDNKNPFKS